MITAADIVSIVFARNLDPKHFADAVVDQGKLKYGRDYVGKTLYDKLTAELYPDIVEAMRNAIAFGLAVETFETIRLKITDQGVNQFTGEGVSSGMDTAAAKRELAIKRDFWLSELISRAKDDEDYEDQGIIPDRVHFTSTERRRNYV